MLLLLPQLAGQDPAFVAAFLAGIVVAALVGMTIHEFAHNYVGHLMGDPMPARLGRLTLNPLVHIHPQGFLMFLMIGFGTLGTAPISARRMRNPRWGYMWAVAAGPLSNLAVASVVTLGMRLFSIDIFDGLSYVFLSRIVLFNVLLFVFNLLPLFPIDGWHIVLALLPADLAIQWERNAQMTQYAFFALLLLSFVPIAGFDPLGLIIWEPLNLIMNLLGFRYY